MTGTAIYYANERRGMKKLSTNDADEICFQIDLSLQTVDVSYEIAPLSNDRAGSLASSIRYCLNKSKVICFVSSYQSMIRQGPTTNSIGFYQVCIFLKF